METQTAFVFIEPKNSKINVHWRWTTFMTNDEELGYINCWIPSFDLYFSAKSDELAKKKSQAIMFAFIDHYLGNRTKGVKQLALELHKLGFKANNDQNTMANLVRNKVMKAKFSNSPSNIPFEFTSRNEMNQEHELELEA